MRQLSPLDSAFLNFETYRSPMHIGGLYIFEGKTLAGQYTYQQFLQHVKSRLHIASVFTERIVEVPFNLDLPYWVADPEFDIEFHCPHLGLVAPHNLDALMSMASDIFARPLDRTRPLWEAHFIEGLDNVEGVPKDSFALIFKVHHCAIDGISGEVILSSLLDITPTLRKVEPNKTKHTKAERKPFAITLLAKSIRPTLQTRKKMQQLLLASAKIASKSFIARLIDKDNAPPLLFKAPPTPFNNAISAHRSFSGTQLSLKTIKEIKKPFEGVTINDVVLSICAGALKKYLAHKNIQLKKPLIVMAPISIRKKKQKHAMGNQVSSMLLSLATDLEDPLARLKVIHNNAEAAKVFNRLTHLEDLAEYIPSLLQALAAKIYSQVRFSQKINPAFNLTITNVPGPQIPLYFDGAKLHSQYGMAPIVDGMGLMLVVMSYNGSVGIGITACRELMPDVKLLAQYINESCDDLLKATSKASKQLKARPSPKTKAKSAKIKIPSTAS